MLVVLISPRAVHSTCSKTIHAPQTAFRQRPQHKAHCDLPSEGAIRAHSKSHEVGNPRCISAGCLPSGAYVCCQRFISAGRMEIVSQSLTWFSVTLTVSILSLRTLSLPLVNLRSNMSSPAPLEHHPPARIYRLTFPPFSPLDPKD
jgi:hypothetical protein